MVSKQKSRTNSVIMNYAIKIFYDGIVDGINIGIAAGEAESLSGDKPTEEQATSQQDSPQLRHVRHCQVL